MIEFIHKYPILIKVLLTVTTVAFVLTGGFFMRDTVQYAARVGDEKITDQQLQDAAYDLESLYRKIYQGNIPEDLYKQMDLKKMALEQLIDRKVMLIAADRMGLEVGDDEINDAVHENPSFKDKQGNFNKSVYLEVLRINNLNPKDYEQSLKEDLTIEKFRNMVGDSVLVTEDDARRYFTQLREAQGLKFDEKAFEEKKETLFSQLEGINRDRTVRSLVQNLKSDLEIEIYPGALPEES